MKRLFYGALVSVSTVLMAAALPLSSKAVTNNQVVVTPSDTKGWTTSDTRTGGLVSYSLDNTAPGNPNNGALQLTTDNTSAAKAQYMHLTQTPLSDVNQLSYYTKQVSASFPQADASYQLSVCLNGLTGCATEPNNFSTLVFEPYYNTTEGTVNPGQWQQWDVAAGNFWSSRSVTCTGGDGTAIAGSPGGPAAYTLAQVKAACPNAVAVGFGVNVGTNNLSYNVEADLVSFNGTSYNFEPFLTATNKDQCKNDGWKDLTDDHGAKFKNQGDCVSWSNHNSQDQSQSNTTNQTQVQSQSNSNVNSGTSPNGGTIR